MLETITFVPGAVAQGQNINLPSWAKRIDAVASAYLIRPTSQLTVSGTALTGADLTATQADHAAAGRHSLAAGNPVVNCTPTKVNEGTITLNVATQAGDLLVLTYIPVGRRAKAA